jgi:hypothetical protein
VHQLQLQRHQTSWDARHITVDPFTVPSCTAQSLSRHIQSHPLSQGHSLVQCNRNGFLQPALFTKGTAYISTANQTPYERNKHRGRDCRPTPQ